MPIEIKNWKLAVLTFLVVALFIKLGCWQVSRAEEKKHLLQAFKTRLLHKPYTTIDLQTNKDWRFFRVELQGSFDNAHTILLDNKTLHGQVGYEIYTPFITHQLASPILVDRGFLPARANRQELPPIDLIIGPAHIIGMLNLPPTYFALGQMHDTVLQWPLRVEYINLIKAGKLLGTALFPYVASLDPHDQRAYNMEWQIVTMGPERHWGYAVQWFALALTLLILFVVLNRRTSS